MKVRILLAHVVRDGMIIATVWLDNHSTLSALTSQVFVFIVLTCRLAPLPAGPAPFVALRKAERLYTFYSFSCRSIIGNVALPYQFYVPAQFAQFPVILPVTLDVAGELFSPKVHIGRRELRSFASRMTMPKTTIYKDDGPPFGKNQVRSSR
jgi:hypothetical protein